MADQSQVDQAVTARLIQIVVADMVKQVAAVLEFMVKERLVQMVLFTPVAPVKAVAAAQMALT